MGSEGGAERPRLRDGCVRSRATSRVPAPCTLTLDDDGGIDLDILIAESKFRQYYEHGAAQEQLNRTTGLCKLAFASDDALDDHKFWLEELASAIEQTSSHDRDC